MSRDTIVQNLQSELADSKADLARLQSALSHVVKVTGDDVALTPTTSARRGRGRPKGSPNRPKDVIAAEKAMKKTTGKRPGRPKGSKNKPKLVVTLPPVEEQTTVSTSPEQSILTNTDIPPVNMDIAPMETPVMEAPSVTSMELPPIQTRESLIDALVTE